MMDVQAIKKPGKKMKLYGKGKHHVAFTPKYRRKIDYWGIREDIRDLCKWKGVAIIEGKVMPDHIHLLLSIPPKYSVSSFMGI